MDEEGADHLNRDCWEALECVISSDLLYVWPSVARSVQCCGQGFFFPLDVMIAISTARKLFLSFMTQVSLRSDSPFQRLQVLRQQHEQLKRRTTTTTTILFLRCATKLSVPSILPIEGVVSEIPFPGLPLFTVLCPHNSFLELTALTVVFQHYSSNLVFRRESETAWRLLAPIAPISERKLASTSLHIFFIDTYIDFLRVRLPTLKACDIYVYQLKYVYEVKCWIFTLKRGE